MCTILDGKSYQLLQLSIDLYDAVRNEARRLGLQIDISSIDRIVREAQALVITPVRPTRVNRDDDPTESYQNREMLGLLNRRLVSPIQPGRSDPKPLRHPEVASSTWSRSKAKRRNPLTTYSNTN